MISNPEPEPSEINRRADEFEDVLGYGKFSATGSAYHMGLFPYELPFIRERASQEMEEILRMKKDGHIVDRFLNKAHSFDT